VGTLRGRDFLDVGDLRAEELRRILELAHDIKAGRYRAQPLAGRYLALVFQKPSHRTRVSFEVGIGRLGGRAIAMGEQDVQIGVRETITDAARVLDRYVDGVVARLHRHSDLEELAAAAEKPVVNALTDRSHPCQVLADLLTMEEALGGLKERRLAFVGDGNNVATSLIEASALLGFPLTVITPDGHRPPAAVLERARTISPDGLRVELSSELKAAAGADAIYTDVWTSMGQEAERERRRTEFARYQVDRRLLELAPGAIFMHCLPAHRGEEVTDEVIDGPRSVVFDQAGNRLYAQMALLAEIFAE